MRSHNADARRAAAAASDTARARPALAGPGRFLRRERPGQLPGPTSATELSPLGLFLCLRIDQMR